MVHPTFTAEDDEDDLFGDINSDFGSQPVGGQLTDQPGQRDSQAGRTPGPARASSTRPFDRPPVTPREPSIFSLPDMSRRRVERFASLFSLSDDTTALVQKVCAVTTAEDEFTAIMCFQAHVMDRMLDSVAVRKASETFSASDKLREFLRLKFSQMILQENLESYSLIKDEHKRLIELSLERTAMLFIQEQDEEFKQQYLPVGFGSEDGDKAQAIVLSVVKDLLKYSRSGLRGTLLTNVLPEAGKPPTKPVPKATALIPLLIRQYLKKETLESDEQLWRGCPGKFRIRAILLRYLTVHYFKFPMTNRRKCQWHAIDALLADLRTRTPEYRKVYLQMIVSRDHALFDGVRTYAAISQSSNFPIPTPLEIQAAIDAGTTAALSDTTTMLVDH